MPRCAHHEFDGGGIAIWYITESSDELRALLATDIYDAELVEKHHEARRAEWLAVRLLVKELFGVECMVAYHPTGQPYLKGSSVHISISHTKGYAALAYHDNKPIGVDIEYRSVRVEQVAPRFTSEEEAAYIEKCDTTERQMYYLINWCAKEALYKQMATPSMADFKRAFRIAHYVLSTQGTLQATICDTLERQVEVTYRLFPNFICVYSL
jgi:4'-phosphopantetheinyl transferase EntD